MDLLKILRDLFRFMVEQDVRFRVNVGQVDAFKGVNDIYVEYSIAEKRISVTIEPEN